MAREFKSKKGYRVFEVSINEILSWGGLAVCDSCNNARRDNVLIPVLNSCYCSECFDEWNKRHEFYPEDVAVQERIINYHKRFFKKGAGQ